MRQETAKSRNLCESSFRLGINSCCFFMMLFGQLNWQQVGTIPYIGGGRVAERTPRDSTGGPKVEWA